MVSNSVRRKVLRALAALMAAPLAGRALGHTETLSLEELDKLAGALAESAKGALAGRLPPSASEAEDLSYQASVIAQGLRQQFIDQPDAASAIAMERGFVDPGWFSEFGVSLLPDWGAANSPFIGLAEVERAQDDDDILRLLWDIITEAIGIRDVASEIEQALREVPELNELFDDIESLFGEGRVEEAIQRILQLLDRLARREILERVLGAIGERGVKKKLLVALGKRCVPFVGPAFLLAGLAIAIHRNWGRIERLLNPQAPATA